MSEQGQIRFVDGAAYERFMGVWSRKVGDRFLDWIAPSRGLSWIDIGCGNGAFTELLVERVAPSAILGIDPSPEQLKFARERHTAGIARFETGDARALPAADKSLDAAVMALVLFFVPEPDKGLSEMVRVTKPGGHVAAYVWDIPDGGFPLAVIQDTLRDLGKPVPLPPRPEVAKLQTLDELWRGAGLQGVETRAITVSRTYEDFETLWGIVMAGPTMATLGPGMSDAEKAAFKARVKAGLPAAADGSITTEARAHAVKGRVPG